MDIAALFESVFWHTATNLVKLIMPIISIYIITRIIYYFIIKGSD